MRRHRRGFTLVELMVVVIIVGILSAIAVPSFYSYVQRSRTAEATRFLGEIQRAQETYRAEFARYATAPQDNMTSFGPFTPTSVGGTDKHSWAAAATPNWDELGAEPQELVMFQYATIAGTPNNAPPAGLGFSGDDFWFVAQARGDLDDDGDMITFEAYSGANHIWASEDKGWE